MVVQWIIVALIGLVALWGLAWHFGLGKKSEGGCPGCNSCEKAKVQRPKAGMR